MTTIKLRVTRPMFADGRSHATGATLQLAPLLAGIAVDSGRCELLNADDRDTISAARLADARHRHSQDRQRGPVGSISSGYSGW